MVRLFSFVFSNGFDVLCLKCLKQEHNASIVYVFNSGLDKVMTWAVLIHSVCGSSRRTVAQQTGYPTAPQLTMCVLSNVVRAAL